ncbi:MAG: hypothetical protein OSA98_25135 [Rubripirellula sp.]|nr:hypothetical protein [Rubripirellula sp.]
MSRLSEAIWRLPGLRGKRRPRWQREDLDRKCSYALNDLDLKLEKYLGSHTGFFHRSRRQRRNLAKQHVVLREVPRLDGPASGAGKRIGQTLPCQSPGLHRRKYGIGRFRLPRINSRDALLQLDVAGSRRNEI